MECWVSQLRAFGPFRGGACLSAQNWSCARDWGSSCWILMHTPAAVALAGPTEEQSSFCWLQRACKELRKALQREVQSPPKRELSKKNMHAIALLGVGNHSWAIVGIFEWETFLSLTPDNCHYLTTIPDPLLAFLNGLLHFCWLYPIHLPPRCVSKSSQNTATYCNSRPRKIIADKTKNILLII